MGKLAEIIGKRSANLTGEVTVETSSGKQRLKTEDSQRVGQHSNAGGEINRGMKSRLCISNMSASTWSAYTNKQKASSNSADYFLSLLASTDCA